MNDLVGNWSGNPTTTATMLYDDGKCVLRLILPDETDEPCVMKSFDSITVSQLAISIQVDPHGGRLCSARLSPDPDGVDIEYRVVITWPVSKTTARPVILRDRRFQPCKSCFDSVTIQDAIRIRRR